MVILIIDISSKPRQVPNFYRYAVRWLRDLSSGLYNRLTVLLTPLGRTMLLVCCLDTVPEFVLVMLNNLGYWKDKEW